MSKITRKFSPVQGGTSFDMSNVVKDFLSKGMQQAP